MIVALVSAVAFCQSPIRAADFFGLVPGLKRTYVTKQDNDTLETTETVLPGRMIDRQGVIPVVTTSHGKKLDTNFFSFDDDGVYHYAAYDESPIRPLRTILKSGDREQAWAWQYVDGAPGKMNCTSRPSAKMTVQGKEVRTITLEITAKVGEDALAVTLKQTAIYGERIGLIELKEIQQSKRTKAERIVKLVQITGEGW